MKLNIKTKAEKTDIYPMRLRLSLIRQLKQLRARADKLGIDFSASIHDLMEGAAKEFEAHLQQKEGPVYKSYTESTTPSLTNGSSDDHQS